MKRREFLSCLLLLGGGRILAEAIGNLSSWLTPGPLSHGGGHATMLTTLTVRRSADGKSLPDFRSAHVYDPWPDVRGRSQSREFTLEDWNRSPFIILVDL